MYLLIHLASNDIPTVEDSLHPTMYLLILIFLALFLAPSVTLHPTMYLLIRNRYIKQ